MTTATESAARRRRLLVRGASLGLAGLLPLIAPGRSMGDVENVRARVDVAGACRYAGIVHFYHQGPQAQGHMRHIDATVNLFNVDSAASMFVFDHEVERVEPATSRTWDQVALDGAIAGRFAGRVIANPSRSRAPGAIYLDCNLAHRHGATHAVPGLQVRGTGA